MVKIRGIKYQVDEVIQVLKEFPDLKNAVLLVQEHNEHDCLVAFIVLEDHIEDILLSELSKFLRMRLPVQAVPDIIVKLAVMPEDKYGHPDIDQLRGIALDSYLEKQDRCPPRDATDRMLLEIFESLLQRVLGIDDDFFDWGGSSLLAVNMLFQIKQKTGQDISLSTLLHKPTVRQLADTLAQ